MDTTDELEPKQAAFCEEYLKDLNGTQAAIRAGYSDDTKTASVQASRLLVNDKVVARIQALMDARSERTQIDADYVISSLKVVAERCLERAPVMVRRGKEFVQQTNLDGANVWKFDSNGANRALELLGKHLKLFVDRHSLENPDGSNLANQSDEELIARAQELASKLPKVPENE